MEERRPSRRRKTRVGGTRKIEFVFLGVLLKCKSTFHLSISETFSLFSDTVLIRIHFKKL